MRENAKQAFAKISGWAKGKDVKIAEKPKTTVGQQEPVRKKTVSSETTQKIEELDKAVIEHETATREPIRGDQKRFNQLAEKIGANTQNDLEKIIADKDKFTEASKVLNDKEFAELRKS